MAILTQIQNEMDRLFFLNQKPAVIRMPRETEAMLEKELGTDNVMKYMRVELGLIFNIGIELPAGTFKILVEWR